MDPFVTIAIPDLAGSVARTTTLSSLAHHTPETHEVVWSGRREHMSVLADATFHVSIIHKQNVSPKRVNGVYWKPYPVEKIRSLMEADWAFYQGRVRGS